MVIMNDGQERIMYMVMMEVAARPAVYARTCTSWLIM